MLSERSALTSLEIRKTQFKTMKSSSTLPAFIFCSITFLLFLGSLVEEVLSKEEFLNINRMATRSIYYVIRRVYSFAKE